MFRFAIGLALFLFQAFPALALEVPTLKNRVTDLAGVLDSNQIASLTLKLQELDKTDSTQIAVLIIPSLEGESLEDYTMRVVEAWKLGMKGQDNGALLFISLKDRKIRIETGYGLEGTLTDASSSQIIRNEIAPRFKTGDFYGGIDAGVTGIIQTVRGNYQASPESETQPTRRKSGISVNLIIILLFPLLGILSATGKWGGGIIGAGAGMLLPFTMISHNLIVLLIGGAVGGLVGILAGALIHSAAKSGGGSGWGGGFFGGSGGGFSGGGDYGGGGGGFSGGGGSFGGGGSSGSW
jgi:uncharacterized protein